MSDWQKNYRKQQILQKKSSLDSNAVGFNSPGDRNINKGVPFSKVLGSLAKDDNDKQSKAIKTEQSSNNCE